MRFYSETLEKTKSLQFVHITIKLDGAVDEVSIEGFLDKARSIFDLLYIDVNKNVHGKGVGRQAMKELRRLYKTIHVHYIQPQAAGFWCKMFQEKLVDSLHWEEGSVLCLSPAKLKIWGAS